MTSPPRFSIITPSFRSLSWLKLCIASVADQGVSLEHIVQDACSDDGTQEWLPKDVRVQTFIEKDRGMYDAVNRGLQRARGEILAYLNCDEQYLPGALAAVDAFFQKHPAIEVVFADALVVDPKGQYLCSRQSLLPQKAHSWVSGNLSILTCATFFRRSVIERRGLLFHPDWRYIGDAAWIVRLLEQQVPMALLPQFTSAFTQTGANLSLDTGAAREKTLFQAKAPAWMRQARPLIVLHHRLRRLGAGHYRAEPFDYAIYTGDSPARRRAFHVAHPSFRWRNPA